jgi:hypothetical protein
MSGTNSANLGIAVNSNNDIYLLPNGNLAMVSGVLGLQQSCANRMKAQLREMFLQPNDGLPTLADVWRTRNFIKWQAVGLATLAAVVGVVRVVSFTISTSGNVFSYTAKILTIYSNTLVTVSDTFGNPAP